MQSFNLNALRQSVVDLGARLASIASEAEVLRRKRDAILNAPANRSDITSMLELWVDRTAATYERDLQTTLAPFIRRPVAAGSPIGDKAFSLVTPADPYSGTFSPKDVNAALCALFKPHVLETLRDTVASMDWAAQGLPMADREAATRDLDQRLATLATEEETLRTQAAELGIHQI